MPSAKGSAVLNINNNNKSAWVDLENLLKHWADLTDEAVWLIVLDRNFKLGITPTHDACDTAIILTMQKHILSSSCKLFR